MRPGVIECAFTCALRGDPGRRMSKNEREFAIFNVCCGDAPNIQWVDVACFGPTVDTAMTLVDGDRCYIEGKLSLRKWEALDGTMRHTLSVVASVLQPLGKIGDQKPKKTRQTSAAKAKSAGGNTQSAAVHQPLPFDDELPI